MKKCSLLTMLAVLFLQYNLLAQEKHELWTMEIFRTGSIMSFEKTVDGVLKESYSGQKVNNVIYNNYFETKGVYSKVDLTLMTYTLFNNDQNQHWSYNITLGAFLNEEPIYWGRSRHYIGVGVDFDYTNSSIYEESTKLEDFTSATIGANLRYDIELGEHWLFQNNLTYAWWGLDESSKWDYKLLIGIETFDGLYLTASPNFLYTTTQREEMGSITEEKASHFYWTFGFGFEI